MTDNEISIAYQKEALTLADLRYQQHVLEGMIGEVLQRMDDLQQDARNLQAKEGEANESESSD